MTVAQEVGQASQDSNNINIYLWGVHNVYFVTIIIIIIIIIISGILSLPSDISMINENVLCFVRDNGGISGSKLGKFLSHPSCEVELQQEIVRSVYSKLQI